MGLIGKALSITGKMLPTLAIVAYFSGWQYVNEYFSSFNINRSSFSFNDYTVFTYSFSVIAAVPKILIQFSVHLLLWLLPFVTLLLGPHLVKLLPRSLPRMMILKIWSWFFLIVGLFFVSQQAGRYDGSYIKENGARSSQVILSKSFLEDMKANMGENWAKQKVEEITRASKNSALALIWRNGSESIFLMFGSTGKLHGKPLEIIRINNNSIVSTHAKPN